MKRKSKGITERKFVFIANHPCLDFINTQMILNGVPTEGLESVEDLVSWLVQAHLMAQSQAGLSKAALNRIEMTSLLEQAKEFRTTLRDLAERIVAHKPIPHSTVNTINQLLSQRSAYPQVVRTGNGFEQRFHSAATSAPSLLFPLAEAACDLLCRADFALIKKCGNPACILYFYDTTKNHARNWCSMQMCGNRMKVAAHYRRQRSKRKQ